MNRNARFPLVLNCLHDESVETLTVAGSTRRHSMCDVTHHLNIMCNYKWNISAVVDPDRTEPPLHHHVFLFNGGDVHEARHCHSNYV
mmetsp:Transcript_26241/g.47380  ORF Transcript_26241/g.47380 Transcript_26241/m.47380 type:complete len:87 (-) Transcript_26241:1473-1733(-)